MLDTAEIDFTTPNTDTKGRIAYDLTNDYMYFNTNGANERLRITSTGIVQLATDAVDFANGRVILLLKVLAICL